MMTLADYKGDVADLEILMRGEKNPEVLRGWVRELVHASRRIKQIERMVLISTPKQRD